MHGSNGNITPFPRANAYLVYNAVSNRLQAPFGVATPRPNFIAARDVEPLHPASGTLTQCAACSGCIALPVHGMRCKRSEEHTSELQSIMRISYDVFSLKKKKNITHHKPP